MRETESIMDIIDSEYFLSILTQAPVAFQQIIYTIEIVYSGVYLYRIDNINGNVPHKLVN
ncbi:hypothetical protein [Epilithonimonas arachidiradicis]|uniref:Uncharacterized protein n=1 Tax=Epilithonimonas arachidiradicis TaxID=1617282 RepID=A0ABQ1WV85_9FLAO|nr:hypothetical protein [Epilithonimonas arachidiradicis]GGG43524.1 hypothetical protein GCM10007332_01270 [Epilithonimonas arachidiradicis]